MGGVAHRCSDGCRRGWARRSGAELQCTSCGSARPRFGVCVMTVSQLTLPLTRARHGADLQRADTAMQPQPRRMPLTKPSSARTGLCAPPTPVRLDRRQRRVRRLEPVPQAHEIRHPPPFPRTNRTSLVPPLVLSGHAAARRAGRAPAPRSARGTDTPGHGPHRSFPSCPAAPPPLPQRAACPARRAQSADMRRPRARRQHAHVAVAAAVAQRAVLVVVIVRIHRTGGHRSLHRPRRPTSDMAANSAKLRLSPVAAAFDAHSAFSHCARRCAWCGVGTACGSRAR